MERDEKARPGLLRTALALFATAVLFNYPWEMAQSPLYQDQAAFPVRAWHCFIASLGDGVMVLLIWTVGSYAFHSRVWFHKRQVAVYSLMLLLGLFVAVMAEEIGLELGRWRYASRMPRLGHLGIVPLLQMLVLPPLIFAVVARATTPWRRGGMTS